MKNQDNNHQRTVGLMLLPIRFVTAWLFLSAVLRRVILVPGKHDIDSSQWMGHKINTFMPQANPPFYDVLEFLCRKPDFMNLFVYAFTYSELFVGVLLLLGLLSRLTGVILLSMGVGLMHTAGWLGPTCLDEWQIASLLVANSLLLILFGSGHYSLDSYLHSKQVRITRSKFWDMCTGFKEPNWSNRFIRFAQASGIIVALYVIAMNQVHHGGVWGKLRNDSTKPNIVIDDLMLSDTLDFSVYRDKGPETYGDFITEISVVDNKSQEDVFALSHQEITDSNLAIENIYINKVALRENCLLIPLGAKADISIELHQRIEEAGNYVLVLKNIAGTEFRLNFTLDSLGSTRGSTQ